MQAHLRRAFPALGGDMSGTAAVADLLSALTYKSPDERPQSALDVAKLLDSLTSGCRRDDLAYLVRRAMELDDELADSAGKDSDVRLAEYDFTTDPAACPETAVLARYDCGLAQGGPLNFREKRGMIIKSLSAKKIPTQHGPGGLYTKFSVPAYPLGS